MKYDFDKVVNRKETSCLKWDYLEAFFGRKELNPMWVADMDFVAPSEIINPILERASHGVFGYTAKSDEFYSAVTGWFNRRYNWNIEKDWIVTTPGVVPALNLAIQEFTQKGDGIIIQSPVYFPFKESVELNERKLLDNQLILKNGRYEINWDDLEQKAKSAEMFVFCSPHNPVSRVWTRSELERLGKICSRYDLFVFSDEIHSDIVFKPNRQLPTASINSDLAGRTISAFATSKTFNLAGLQLSVNIIPDIALRKRFKLALGRLHMGMNNIFGIVGTQAAYNHGEPWLDQLLEYLQTNYRTVSSFMKENIPEIDVIKPDGTFLLWLDCRRLKLTDEELEAFFVQKAGLALTAGIMFGPGGSGFMRMNIGCPVRQICDALNSLKLAMKNNTPVTLEKNEATVPEDC